MTVLSRQTRLSGLEPLQITPESNFINVGERTNVTGSKQFKKLIMENRFDEAVAVAQSTVELGCEGARGLVVHRPAGGNDTPHAAFDQRLGDAGREPRAIVIRRREQTPRPRRREVATVHKHQFRDDAESGDLTRSEERVP